MIPAHLTPHLAVAADGAINSVLQTGARHHGQSPPTGEVGFVAAVALGGMRRIANAWRPILRPAGYSVKLSGVFCHQHPRATFTDLHGKSVSCELADLLVVVDDLTGLVPGRRWAALIQAKLATHGSNLTLTSSGDLRQLDLLSRWPAFTLPANFAPGPRDFGTCRHAGTILDCARYGLIAAQPSPVWFQQTPATSMPVAGDQLGTFLAHMMEAGQSGYGREATGTADDWSRTVNELMTVTYANLFSHAAGFSGSRQRGHSGLAFALSDWPIPYWPDIFFSAGPPPSGGRPEGPEDDGPGDGISVLRIGISRVDPEDD